MALQGAIREFGTIELLQFPHTGKKTCELVLSNNRGEALLYYEKGKLVHAKFGNKVGEEVIKEVVDWEDGVFELRFGIEAQDRTVEKDLHRLILLALKERDERKLVEQKQKEGLGGFERGLGDELNTYRKESGFALHISILDNSGRVLAQTSDPEAKSEKFEELQKFLSKVVQLYPRKGLKKIFYEDESGLVMMMRLDNSRFLLVVSRADRSPGAVSLGVNKLAMKLSGKVAEKR